MKFQLNVPNVKDLSAISPGIIFQGNHISGRNEHTETKNFTSKQPFFKSAMITRSSSSTQSRQKTKAPIFQCHSCVLVSTLYTEAERLQAIHSNQNGDQIAKTK